MKLMAVFLIYTYLLRLFMSISFFTKWQIGKGN